MTHNEMRTVNAITKKLASLQTALVISIYFFIINMIKERIQAGSINIRQLKELAETPLLTELLIKEIKSFK